MQVVIKMIIKMNLYSYVSVQMEIDINSSKNIFRALVQS